MPSNEASQRNSDDCLQEYEARRQEQEWFRSRRDEILRVFLQQLDSQEQAMRLAAVEGFDPESVIHRSVSELIDRAVRIVKMLDARCGWEA